ncbi:DEAD/DEAH box helicase family protein [Bifidobacterium sp. 82T24]|nr:DEAD/DEAH box helicase family protein [Bifidobacterium pluvialisilvae]
MSDPVTSCFYDRRAIEALVEYLYYDVLGLRRPYGSDNLNALLNESGFKCRVDPSIWEKFDTVRRVGNRAAHDGKPNISAKKAQDVIEDLYLVMIWAGYNMTAHYDKVPMGTRFDVKLAKQAMALNPDQFKTLLVNTQKKFNEHRKAIEERERLIEAKDEAIAEQLAELKRLREQIKQAQAAAPADTHDYTYNEAATRALLIDELLAEQGWRLGDNNREFKITGLPKTPQRPSGIGYADYVLWDDDGLPLAVVEAKKSATSVEVGLRQAREYADGLEKMTGQRPVIFASNGYETKIWDDAAGYPERSVAGFYRKNELRRLIQRRTDARRLIDESPNTAIAGRPYQLEAIAKVDEAFDERHRAALLVMATGTGKTRVTIALIDQLMKAGWVKNVLFLADRRALVNQAAKAFRDPKSGLGASTPIVNLLNDPDATGRIYLSTYPTMMNLVNARRRGSGGAGDGVDDDFGELKFGPGFFDLIVIDEAHRSVYAKYGFLFDYFDSLLVGLTATPKNEVDRNTYRLFNLEYDERKGGVPTAAYSLDEAVRDGYLVPARGVQVSTGFIHDGISYELLSDEEKLEWEEQDWNEDGDVPDSVSAGDINRFLFNDDTIDKVLKTVMENGIKVDDGNALGKTIIFARNQRHAEVIKARFDANWPEYGGTFAQIITHQTRNAQQLIDDFSEADKREPQIAISVDMLDTGIDVPEVVNLVFFKPVMSKTKYWQMIGRGTRLCPGLFGPAGEPGSDKTEFRVFDCCGNFEFFNENPPEASTRQSMSLNERLFRLRVGLVETMDAARRGAGGTAGAGGAGDAGAGGGDADDGGAGDAAVADLDDDIREYRAALARSLGGYVAGMDARSNVLVRPHRQVVEEINGGGGAATDGGGADGARGAAGGMAGGADGSWWDDVTPAKAAKVVTLAGLPSSFRLDDEGAGVDGGGMALSSVAKLPAKRFDELMLRYELGVLLAENQKRGIGTSPDAAPGADGDDLGIGLPQHNLLSVKNAVRDIVTELMSPKNRAIPSVQAQSELLEAVAGEDWWQDVTVPMLEHARKSLRGIAHYAAASKRNIVHTDFEDTLDEVREVEIVRGGDVADVDYRRFRERALAFLRSEEGESGAADVLRRVRSGAQLTQHDLDDLGRMFVEHGVGSEDDIAAAGSKAKEDCHVDDDGDHGTEIDGFGLFLRSLVGLDPAAVQQVFARFLDGKRYSARQIEFVNAIVRELTAKGVMDGSRLYEQPFVDLAAGGPDDLFVESDLDDMFAILDGVTQSAIPLRKAA